MERLVLGVSLAVGLTAACGPNPAPTGTGGTGGNAGGGNNPFCAVKQVLDAKCTSCHADIPNSGAPMPLTSYAATQRNGLNGQKIFSLIGARVASGTMPPGGGLSAQEQATLVDWANAGGPGSECAGQSRGTCATDPSYCIGEQYLPCKPDIYLRAHAPGNANKKFTVPANASDRYNCYQFPNPFAGGKYEIAEAAAIDNYSVIHHWLVFGTNTPQAVGDVDDSGGCTSPEQKDTLLSGWAPGATNSVFPKDVGLLLNQYKYLTLQIHYNNPTNVPADDASGVAYCTTTQVPPNIAGIVTLGQDYGVTAPAGAVNFPGGSGTCNNLFAAGSGTATIIESFPHMHRMGSGFTTEHLRNGQLVDYVSDVPLGTWAFDQQTHYPHNELGTGRIQILPGDTLRTTCFYTNPTATNVVFGTKTSDEMCYDFVIAYPIQQLRRGCGTLFVSFNQ